MTWEFIFGFHLIFLHGSQDFEVFSQAFVLENLLNVFQDCEDLKYSIINHFFTKNNTFVEVSFWIYIYSLRCSF